MSKRKPSKANQPGAPETAAQSNRNQDSDVTKSSRTRGRSEPGPESLIILFETTAEFEDWLSRNHDEEPGIWLRIAKKKAPYTSITYAQAVDVALCFGWIDSQLKTFDEHSFVQKFTPRRKKSLWSKINREKVESLEAAGLMREPGSAEVDRAKVDGRWDAAYDPASKASVPDDLQLALETNPKALEFFETLDRTNRYSILWRVQTATSATTRQKKIRDLVAMLARREEIH